MTLLAQYSSRFPGQPLVLCRSRTHYRSQKTLGAIITCAVDKPFKKEVELEPVQ